MGVNAQTTVPTFTAAQVLTADQMNQSARTGVPVFADTTARDAAFGGSGEKTLAEGQLCYVENLTGVAQIQYYDGAAWVSLSASGVDIIKAQTAFTAAATINIDNIFTTTYSKVQLIVRITAKSTTLQVLGRMRVGGVDAATGYYFAAAAPDYATAAWLYKQRSNNATSLAISVSDNRNLNIIELDFYGAADVERTTIYGRTTPVQDMEMAFASGGHNTAAAYDGFSILTSTGTITGTYTVLGYKQ